MFWVLGREYERYDVGRDCGKEFANWCERSEEGEIWVGSDADGDAEIGFIWTVLFCEGMLALRMNGGSVDLKTTGLFSGTKGKCNLWVGPWLGECFWLIWVVWSVGLSGAFCILWVVKEREFGEDVTEAVTGKFGCREGTFEEGEDVCVRFNDCGEVNGCSCVTVFCVTCE